MVSQRKTKGNWGTAAIFLLKFEELNSSVVHVERGRREKGVGGRGTRWKNKNVAWINQLVREAVSAGLGAASVCLARSCLDVSVNRIKKQVFFHLHGNDLVLL